MKSPRSVRPSENPEGEEMESEEMEKSRVRETESVPSAKEVEERNVERAVLGGGVRIVSREEQRRTGTERLRRVKWKCRRSVWTTCICQASRTERKRRVCQCWL